MKIFVKVLISSLFLTSLFLPGPSSALAAEGKDFQQLRTEHFIINYQDGVSKNYLSKIKNTAEKFYRVITQEFNLIRDELWLWDNRAQVFIAKDRESYLEKFNCSSWSAACVNYRDKIIYTFPNQSSFSSIFIHELTHIIFRERSGQGNFPLWLDEGAATYVENKHGRKLYSQNLPKLKKLIANDSYINFEELSKLTVESLNSKDKEYVSNFYLQSFSVVNFIIAKYGKYKLSFFLNSLKKGKNFEAAISEISYQLKSLNDLEKQWKRFYHK